MKLVDLMRYQKIDENKYILYYLDNYFEVNKTTKFILDNVDKFENQEEFIGFVSKEYGISYDEAYEYVAFVNKNLDIKKSTQKDTITKKYLPELSSPLNVYWELTRHCNLRCKHCYKGYETEKKMYTCTKEEAMKIAEKIVKSGIMHVYLSGGEVFTVPYINELIIFLTDHNIDLTVYTNGTICNQIELLAKNLNQKDFLCFNISIDGAEKEHDIIRGKGNYKKTLKTIKLLKKNNINTKVNLVMNKINYKTIPDVYETFLQMGINQISLSTLSLEGAAMQNKALLLMTREELDELKEILKKYIFAKPKEKFFYMQYYNYKDRILKVKRDNTEILYENKWQCYSAKYMMYIWSDGTVTACSHFKDKYVLGNILKNSIEKLWNNETRKKFIKITEKVPYKCILFSEKKG